jgi:cation:H+ antiporter
MDLLLDLFLLSIGLVLLYFGGEWLVKGAGLLARHLGVPPIVIGATVVAMGTSTPELVVSLHAALTGKNDISLGNVVGSNIANIALILGVAVFIRSITWAPSVAKTHAPFMVGATLLCMVMMIDGRLALLDALLLLAGLVAYVVVCVRESRAEPEPDPEIAQLLSPPPDKGMGYFALLIAAGLSLLVLGAHLLVESAVDIARLAGVSEAFIGLTIVAVGTSLPELTTSVVAALRNEGDIAIGNVVGSNTFNILFILGITAAIEPLRMGGVQWSDMFAMLFVAMVLMAMVFYMKRIGRRSGITLMAGYVAYLAWLAGHA